MTLNDLRQRLVALYDY